jgi:hypothetical protein
MRKVFCIGFHKTGTSSMREALEILGYRVTGPDHTGDRDIAETLHRVTADLSQRFDAFQDNPWPLVWREMDALHPGSKFILTVRDPQKWYDSNRNHFGGQTTPMRALVYGPDAATPEGNEALYKARLVRHEREVRAYFRDRPDDLLVLDLGRDGRWEPLCAFLGHPVPARPFPHANRIPYGRRGRIAAALRWRTHRLLRRLGGRQAG